MGYKSRFFGVLIEPGHVQQRFKFTACTPGLTSPKEKSVSLHKFFGPTTCKLRWDSQGYVHRVNMEEERIVCRILYFNYKKFLGMILVSSNLTINSTVMIIL